MKLRKGLEAKDIERLAGLLDLFEHGRVLERDFVDGVRAIICDDPAGGWKFEPDTSHPYYSPVKRWTDQRMAWERARKEDLGEQ